MNVSSKYHGSLFTRILDIVSFWPDGGARGKLMVNCGSLSWEHQWAQQISWNAADSILLSFQR